MANFDYVGHNALSELKRLVFSQAKPNLDDGYTALNERVVIKPGDPLRKVYVKQLEVAGYVWFSNGKELDENKNTLMFSRTEEGNLVLISDKRFAFDTQFDALKEIWQGKTTPVFMDEFMAYYLADMAKDYGWEKPEVSIAKIADHAIASAASHICSNNDEQEENMYKDNDGKGDR